MRTCPNCQREFTQGERVCPDDGTLLRETVSSEEQVIGRILDKKFRIDGFLKRGGMGSVYRGTHLLLNKQVAIKLIRPELVTSHDMVERFFREARAAAKLSHPNIVTVHDLGQAEDGTLYIIMELVDGRSLKEVIQTEGPWEPARALRLVKGVASALSLAHRNGIVHRDLKPQNIMLFTDSDGNEGPKLLDFGIAKTFEPESPALTSTGMVLGTPHYMSAEQAKGLPADHRSDIYALGVILYEMLVGKVPFDDKSIPSILVKHLTEPPRPPSSLKGGIPREVEALVLRCLEKEPDKRVQSADELSRTLTGLMDTTTERPLDPTVAMESSMEMLTVESTMAGAAAAAAPGLRSVPPPPPPAGDATNKMESGTLRAREVGPRPSMPPPVRVEASRRSGAGIVLFAAIGVGFVLVLAAGAFVLLRLANRGSQEAPTAAASLQVPPATPLEAETPPPSDPGSDELSVPVPATPSESEPAPSRPEQAEVPASSPPTREARPANPPPQGKKAQPTPAPPAAQARSEPDPPAAPPQSEPIPDKPSVVIECDGVRDACGVLRVALRDALDRRGMPAARPMRADVILRVQAEEIEARSETQFGNTFVIRTYSVTIDADAPRFGDSVSLPPHTFSFDARLGRDKLRAEAHVISTRAAERVERYWETKRSP